MVQQSAAIGVDQHMEAIMDVSGKVGLGTVSDRQLEYGIKKKVFN